MADYQSGDDKTTGNNLAPTALQNVKSVAMARRSSRFRHFNSWQTKASSRQSGGTDTAGMLKNKMRHDLVRSGQSNQTGDRT
jgi:hypothetical protein